MFVGQALQPVVAWSDALVALLGCFSSTQLLSSSAEVLGEDEHRGALQWKGEDKPYPTSLGTLWEH